MFKMEKKFEHLSLGGGISKWLTLALLLLLWSAKPAAAINVYSRIIKYVQNPQTKNYEVKVVDTMQVYFHVWKRTTTTSDDGTTSSSDEELQWGFDNSEKGKTKQKPSTASIEGA